jgi:hypothetical protein
MRNAICVIALSLMSFTARSGSPTFYADLDTKEGHFSTWRADSLEDTGGCTFTLEISSVYKHAKWYPVATLSARDEAESKFAYIQFYPGKDRSQLRTHVRILDEAGDTKEDSEFLITVGTPVSMAIRWNGERIEFIADGNIVASVRRSFVVHSFHASVSTAQMKLRDLSFQQ